MISSTRRTEQVDNAWRRRISSACLKPSSTNAAAPNGVLPEQLDLFAGEEVQLTIPADNDNDPSNDGQVTS